MRGCSGWFNWHRRGTVYPADLPTEDWFAHYAGRFRTVELNAPFYAWPTVAAVRGWVRQAGRRRFVYTVKVSELITHVKRFEGCKTLEKDFGHVRPAGRSRAVGDVHNRAAGAERTWVEEATVAG